MRRRLGWLLFLVCGVAHAAGHHGRWGAVKRLAAGIEVLVQTAGSAPELCAVVSVDDAVLRCDPIPDPNANGAPASMARLVFARTAVTNVWRWEEDQRWSRGRWIGIVISAALEIAGCVSGPAGCVVFGAILSVGWFSAWVTGLVAGSPPRSPKMRRRVIYEAPVAPLPTAGAQGAGATP